ncbi:MAG: sugar ABC transporter substrate-binding protein [Oligoflexus sp.]
MRRLLVGCLLLMSLLPIGAKAENKPQELEKTPIKIQFWEQDPPEVGQELDKWIKVYTSDKPWLTIARQQFENEELRTRFLRSSLTGEGADLVYGPSDLVGVFATAQVIQPLDDFIKTDPYDPQLIRLMQYKGKLWGAPISSGSHLVLYYNRKLVENAPASFEEIIGVGQKFMQNKPSGHYGLAYYQSEPFWFVPFMGAFGAWPLQVKNDQVEVTIDLIGTQKALQFVRSLQDEFKIIPTSCDFECAKSMFFAEQAPYHINGDWEISSMLEQFGDNLGVAPLPFIAEAKQHMTPMVGGRFFFLNAQLSGEKRDAVLDFVRFTASLPIQTRLATRLNKIPATMEAREHKLVKSEPWVQALLEATRHGKDFPNHVEMRAAWDGMRIMIQRGLSGRESPEQAVKTGQKAAEEALKALRKSPKP